MYRPVLEREHELAELADAAREAASGRGCVVLVSGEAGIGKSRLVDAARAQLPAEGRVLVGHCDDLATARVLGPFRDLVGEVGTELAAALRGDGDRDVLLGALRAELARRLTLLAIEDVHWADDATVDVLHYLVRRIAQLPAVLILTYRDDEVPAGHPVRRLLGSASESGGARHLPLRRLTIDAVRRLSADTAVDPAEVHAVTAGNPFFVGEVLASGTVAEVPHSVADAVLARVRRLDPSSLAATEQLSVLPTTIERWLVDRVVVGGLSALARAESSGLLTVTPTRLSFRHELTRRAIADGLPTIRRLELNARVLAALLDQDGVDMARIVHHAVEAGDQAAVVRYGPAAAREAADGGAHREAAAYYRMVLEHPATFPIRERADLLAAYAVECFTVGDYQEAVRAQQQLIEIRRELADGRELGAALHWLARMHQHGDRMAAEAAAAEAIAVLEPLGTSRLLALAHTHASSLLMIAFRHAEARPLAERAIQLARATGDAVTLSHALTANGVCRWDLELDDGLELMQEGLQVALDAGAADPACRAYITLICSLIDRHRLPDAERYVQAGREYAERTEHFGSFAALTVLRSRIQLGRGRWEEAAATLADLSLDEPRHGSIARTVLGRIAARKGTDGAADQLAAAVELARRTDDLHRITLAAAASAEAAWLRGDSSGVRDIAGATFAETYRLNAMKLWPELGYWLHRAGYRVAMTGSDSPFALLALGRWREAAEQWRIGDHPYEHAMALAESSDPADLLVALERLNALGAGPLGRMVRHRLRGLGVTHIPRGVIAATRENPAGLTARQLEVLRLLCDGLSNAEIAERLVISVRTAGNHVGAVLAKLGVRTRADAATRARELVNHAVRPGEASRRGKAGSGWGHGAGPGWRQPPS